MTVEDFELFKDKIPSSVIIREKPTLPSESSRVMHGDSVAAELEIGGRLLKSSTGDFSENYGGEDDPAWWGGNRKGPFLTARNPTLMSCYLALSATDPFGLNYTYDDPYDIGYCIRTDTRDRSACIETSYSCGSIISFDDYREIDAAEALLRGSSVVSTDRVFWMKDSKADDFFSRLPCVLLFRACSWTGKVYAQFDQSDPKTAYVYPFESYLVEGTKLDIQGNVCMDSYERISAIAKAFNSALNGANYGCAFLDDSDLCTEQLFMRKRGNPDPDYRGVWLYGCNPLSGQPLHFDWMIDAYNDINKFGNALTGIAIRGCGCGSDGTWSSCMCLSCFCNARESYRDYSGSYIYVPFSGHFSDAYGVQKGSDYGYIFNARNTSVSGYVKVKYYEDMTFDDVMYVLNSFIPGGMPCLPCGCSSVSFDGYTFMVDLSASYCIGSTGLVSFSLDSDTKRLIKDISDDGE